MITMTLTMTLPFSGTLEHPLLGGSPAGVSALTPGGVGGAVGTMVTIAPSGDTTGGYEHRAQMHGLR